MEIKRAGMRGEGGRVTCLGVEILEALPHQIIEGYK